MSTATSPSPLLRLALEAGPLGIFFLVNARVGIYAATGAFMVAIVVSLVVSRVVEKRFPIMPLVTAVFVLVFGGLTLVLQDDLFIKLKPTLVNALFGTTLLVGLALGRSLLKPVLGGALALDDAGWRTMTLRWGLFFYFLCGGQRGRLAHLLRPTPGCRSRSSASCRSRSPSPSRRRP